MTSTMPVWLPGVLFVVVFLGVGVLISLHPRFRNSFRPSHQATGQPTLFQKRPTGSGVMSMDVVGLLHFKSAGWWLGAVSGVALALAMAQMPLPIAVPATAAALLLAVLAYLRPKRAVQSCNVDQNGALTLMRGDVRIPFDLNHYRYIRLYSAKNRAIYLSEHARAVSRREAKHVDVHGQCPVSTGRRRLQPLADCRRFLCRAARPGCPVYQACVRAGHTPTQRNNFFISPGWDVRPQ